MPSSRRGLPVFRPYASSDLSKSAKAMPLLEIDLTWQNHGGDGSLTRKAGSMCSA